jgi:ClpP class serine protease
MGAYAASGGYYIAAPAKRLIAEPTTVTGSIGVIGMLPSAQAVEDKWGVSFHLISSSDRKDMLNLGSRASAEDKALLDNIIAHVYRTFTKKVAEGRHMPIEKVEIIAQGRVYTGLQAKELGLVDDIGGIDDAFRAAKELAGFDVNKLYPILRYQEGGFRLSDCLRRPSHLRKCLKDAGKGTHLLSTVTRATSAASLLSSVVTSGGPLSTALNHVNHEFAGPAALNGRTEQVAATVTQWALAPERDRALMLWSGYLSLVWH